MFGPPILQMRKQRPRGSDLTACSHLVDKQRVQGSNSLFDSKPQALCTKSQIHKLVRDFQVSPEVEGSRGGLLESQLGSTTLQPCRWGCPAS